MDNRQADRQVFAGEGMTCQGCVGTVTAALEKLPGVESVDVSLEKKQAVVVGSPAQVTAPAVVAAVEKAGYKARAAGP